MPKNARKFDQACYDLYDGTAKDLFADFLKRRGHVIISQEEDFNHDILTELNGQRFYFEVEFKIGYPFTDQKSFRFQSVSFLGRKKRLHDISAFHYIVICKETNWAVSCYSSEIFEESFKRDIKVNDIFRSGDDQVYHVPKGLCLFYKIK